MEKLNTAQMRFTEVGHLLIVKACAKLVIPQGFVDDLTGKKTVPSVSPADTQASAATARAVVIGVEPNCWNGRRQEARWTQ